MRGSKDTPPARRGRPRRAGALSALLWLATLVPTAWFCLFLAFGDRWWWLFVLNSLAPVLFFPVPLALLLAWLTKRRFASLAALVPAAIAAFLWLGAFLPAKATDPAVLDRSAAITLLTFNVEAGNHDVEGLAAAVLESGAQLVALQELNEEVGLRLAERLRATHPYADLAPCPPCGDWGSLGVLSAFPVTPVDADLEGPSPRNPQVTLVHHPRGDLLLVNVHNLSTPRFPQIWPDEIGKAVASRERVARALVALAEDASVPVVALGDFNTTERSAAYRTLTKAFEDAWKGRGFGFGSTFHGGPPQEGPARLALPDWLLRIDYVFHTPDLATVSVKVGAWLAASDHRPVSALLAFPE